MAVGIKMEFAGGTQLHCDLMTADMGKLAGCPCKASSIWPIQFLAAAGWATFWRRSKRAMRSRSLGCYRG